MSNSEASSQIAWHEVTSRLDYPQPGYGLLFFDSRNLQESSRQTRVWVRVETGHTHPDSAFSHLQRIRLENPIHKVTAGYEAYVGQPPLREAVEISYDQRVAPRALLTPEAHDKTAQAAAAVAMNAMRARFGNAIPMPPMR